MIEATAPSPSNAASLAPPLGQADAAGQERYLPALLFFTCLAAKVYLVFFKSFNWDEFLHYTLFLRFSNHASSGSAAS